MASAIDILIEQAESLLRKKIAIKESVPGVFEALSNVDDQLRTTINQIVANQKDGDLTSAQVNLINTALVGTRTAIASYQADYRPTVNDLTAEFSMLPQVDLRRLRRLKEDDAKLYELLVNQYMVITETNFSDEFSVEDLNFLNNKEVIYETLNDTHLFVDSYINDQCWESFINIARSRHGALWSDVQPKAAKLMQERYGFEFNVRNLNKKGK